MILFYIMYSTFDQGNTFAFAPVQFQRVSQKITKAPQRKPNEKIEGFWYSEYEPYYPMPISTSTKVDNKFLQKLTSILNTKNDTNNIKIEWFDGCSDCRLCEEEYGSQTFHCTFNGITWSFPSGLIHYYQDHNVQPSNDFYKFIMEFKSV